MWGIYQECDEWSDSFGAGERCPKCGAPDWHQDPTFEEFDTWGCESCGHMVNADTGAEIIMPQPQPPKPLTPEEEQKLEDALRYWHERAPHQLKKIPGGGLEEA